MYAIIQTGGKQYRAEPGALISVEKIEAEPGSQIELTEVLMIRTDDGLRVGSPYIEGAKVIAEVVRQGKAPKIIGFKYKPKKNERKRWGHRQPLTWLKVKESRGSRTPEGGAAHLCKTSRKFAVACMLSIAKRLPIRIARATMRSCGATMGIWRPCRAVRSRRAICMTCASWRVSTPKAK